MGSSATVYIWLQQKMAVVVTWELTKLSLDLEVIAFHNTLNLTWSWKNEEKSLNQMQIVKFIQSQFFMLS